jgi:hydrogenase maturation protease
MMVRAANDILLIGYGNPGRLDDGLGPALAAEIAALKIPHVTVDANYQLTVEDAAQVARFRRVIFADAATDGAGPFYFRPITAGADLDFTTHSVSPSAVLGLARDLFAAQVTGYALGIRGFVFNGFGERLSGPARTHLRAAVAFLAEALRGGGLETAASAHDRQAFAMPNSAYEVTLCTTENT